MSLVDTIALEVDEASGKWLRKFHQIKCDGCGTIPEEVVRKGWLKIGALYHGIPFLVNFRPIDPQNYKGQDKEFRQLDFCSARCLKDFFVQLAKKQGKKFRLRRHVK